MSRSEKVLHPDYCLYGPEPSHLVGRLEFIHALNWYRHYYLPEDTPPWIESYLLKIGEGKSSARRHFDLSAVPFAAAVIARVASRGGAVDPHHLDYLSQALRKARRTRDETPIKPLQPAPIVPKDRFNPLIADFDDVLDRFYRSNYRKSPVINLIISDYRKGDIKEAVAYYNGILGDIEMQPLTAEARREYSKIIKNFLGMCDKVLNVPAAPRKARQKKRKSLEAQASKFKYAKTIDSVSLKGESPLNIIDATVCIAFDTEKRTLRVLTAMSDMKLGIKGTTIMNVDPDKSFSKTIRKPEVLKEIFKDGARARILSAIRAIKSKEQATTGRSSDSLFIVKCFR